KTRPSPAALDWFAERLGVDRMALAGESTAAIMAACEAAVTRAEAEIEAHRDAEALAELEGVRDALRSPGSERLALRLRLARGWALQNVGRLDDALVELAAARQAAEHAGSGDAVALALYRIGVVRYKMGSLATAASLLDEALRACETTVDPSDALRARIFNARAKIRRRQKDFTAAAEDVEQALELAHALNDDRVLAETYLDASLVAERRNEYTRAREHAERSKALFERVADHEYAGGGGTAPARVVQDRGGAGQSHRRGLRGVVAGIGTDAQRRSGGGDRERISRDRVIEFARGIPRRRRERSNRDRPRVACARPARPGGGVLQGRGGLFCGCGDGEPSRRRMGRARGCGPQQRGSSKGSGVVPAGGRSLAGRSLVGEIPPWAGGR